MKLPVGVAHATMVMAAFCPVQTLVAQDMAPADRMRAIAAVDRAADAAERSAIAAEQAAKAARDAAESARGAADAARAAALAAGVKLPPWPDKAPVDQAAASDDSVAHSEPAALSSVETYELPAAPGEPSAEQIKRAKVSALAGSAVEGPPGSVVRSAIAPEFSFLASDKDKIANIAWTFDISAPNTDKNGISADQITLAASAKLGSTNEARFLGPKGFPGGTEAKLTYTHFSGKVDFEKILQISPEVEALASAACTQQQPRPADDKPETLAASAAKCNPRKYNPGGVSAFVLRYYPVGYKELYRGVFAKPLVYGGGSVGVSGGNYSYLDRTAFAIKKDSKLGVSGSVFGGVLFDHGHSSLTGSYTYKRQYDEQDAVSLCNAISAAQTQCLTGPDGAPVRKASSIFAFEGRHLFPSKFWNFSALGVAPEVSYDVTGDVFTADLPIYFVREASGGLRGGFRLTYMDEPEITGGRKDGVTFGVFVGVPLSGIPLP